MGAGVAGTLGKGRSDSGKLARFAAAGSVGKYSAPGCPQEDRQAALSARLVVVTRIRGIRNITKL